MTDDPARPDWAITDETAPAPDPWAYPADSGPPWGTTTAAPASPGWGTPDETNFDPWGVFPPPETDGGWNLQTSHYTKKMLIAQHGQGEVWLGELAGTDKKFAIKYLLTSPSFAGDQVTVRRFEREVRAQSSLNHPGIMPVIYSNFDDDPPWFVMPLAWGSLRKFFQQIAPGKASAKIPEQQSVELILGVAEALSHAHKEGVVHRDVKPENILYLDG